MMQFKVSDEKKMPTGISTALTAENRRPAEYYQAIRKQKQALSSLSLVHGKRTSEQFLKARSSDKVRHHYAEANL